MNWQSGTIGDFVVDNLTLVLLLAAGPLFLWLAVNSRRVRSFQFQVSVFILIWIIGEVVDLLNEAQFVQIQLGMQVHLAAMAFFAAMLWIRFYRANKFGRTMIESSDDNLI